MHDQDKDEHTLLAATLSTELKKSDTHDQAPEDYLDETHKIELRFEH